MWRRCALFGVLGLPVPAQLGGAGADALTTSLLTEALGYECQDNGLLFSLNAQMWSVALLLVTFGTPPQQGAYLPGMVSGDFTMGEADLLPENFASVNTICAHLRARESGKKEAAHG